MRPFSPFCGTVLNAQLLSLPEIIRMIAPGVVTTQLSHLPPASSSATEVAASSESRLATAQPPLPAPTTTKSNVSVTATPQILLDHSGATRSIEPGISRFRVCALCIPERRWLRHEPQHLLQPRDLPAIGRIEIGEPVEHRSIEHRL